MAHGPMFEHKNYFTCCINCADRVPACSDHCTRYADAKAELEKEKNARYEASRWKRRMIRGNFYTPRRDLRK
nr:MAG TPA: hypothetical protein [Caudoviricetes sp.]